MQQQQQPVLGGGGVGVYDAFSQYATATTELAANPGGASSGVLPYASATAAAAAAAASLHLFDESASSWVVRDASNPSATGASSAGGVLAQLVRQQLGGAGGPVRLWRMVTCFEPTGTDPTTGGRHWEAGGRERPLWADGDDADDSAGASESVTRLLPQSMPDVKLHAGDVLEVYGAAQAGKSEIVYATILHGIMPKSVTSSLLSCTLRLGGLDGGVVLLDFDQRFSIVRLERLMRARIERALARALGRRIVEEQRGHLLLSGDDMAGGLGDLCDRRLASLVAAYFESAEYADLRQHCLASLFVFHAQTPRQALVAFLEAEALLQEYGRTHQKVSWARKEALRRRKTKAEGKGQGEELAPTGPAAGEDVEMKVTDVDDPAYNPPLPDGGGGSTGVSSSSALPPLPPAPRSVFLIVENAAAFKWQTQNQPIGHAGIATGMYTPERRALGAGAASEQGMVGGPAHHQQLSLAQSRSASRDNSWFYEMFAHRVRGLLHRFGLVGVITKPTVVGSDRVRIHQWEHEERLGLSYNSLVTHRIIVREEREAQSLDPRMRMKYVVGSHEYDRQQALSSRLAQRGSLRAANLKIIKQAHGQQAAASSAAAAAKAQWEFAFRIANEGIKPAQ